MASLERRVAVDAARVAGLLLHDEVSGARRITYKDSPTNLVTEMDQRAEAEILGRLRATFPDDAILSEETGASPGHSGRRWIIDPLDGTTNYAHGLPVFGVSIALEAERRIILGVVYDPSRDELFVAERGRGATLGDAPIRVSASASLGESLLTTGFPYNIRDTRDTNLPEYAAFSVRARAVRRLGSAVLDLAYVACGRFDAFWELRVGRGGGEPARRGGRRDDHRHRRRPARRGRADARGQQRPRASRRAARAEGSARRKEGALMTRWTIGGTACLVLALVLAGCTALRGMREVSPDAVRLAPVADQATVIFLRAARAGTTTSLFELRGSEQRFIGLLVSDARLVYRTAPGRTRFMVIGLSADFLDAELAAGKTYQVAVLLGQGQTEQFFVLRPVRPGMPQA